MYINSDNFAGNLLVLRDGRVGFIDFGIVGKISPLTFQALQAFLVSSMSADYDTMAKALITMGVTEETVIVEVCCVVREFCRTVSSCSTCLSIKHALFYGGHAYILPGNCTGAEQYAVVSLCNSLMLHKVCQAC